MFDPRLVILFGLIFIGLGIFNLVMGRRRILRARAQGESPVWYKQIAILTGIEYLLLSVAFFLSISLSYDRRTAGGAATQAARAAAKGGGSSPAQSWQSIGKHLTSLRE